MSADASYRDAEPGEKVPRHEHGGWSFFFLALLAVLVFVFIPLRFGRLEATVKHLQARVEALEHDAAP